jgi:hypothetical protein
MSKDEQSFVCPIGSQLYDGRVLLMQIKRRRLPAWIEAGRARKLELGLGIQRCLQISDGKKAERKELLIITLSQGTAWKCSIGVIKIQYHN